jgi:hypothetical protein
MAHRPLSLASLLLLTIAFVPGCAAEVGEEPPPKPAATTATTAAKLDGASKEAMYFDVAWEAEEVRWSD